MAQRPSPRRRRGFFARYWKQLLIFLSVFGPATITAMADNDAGGVATYSIAGARLGYPILFLLVIITILLGVTQEMGMRLAVISRKGLADLIREKFGVRTALFMFGALLVANLGTLITDLSAVKTTSTMLNLPAIPSVDRHPAGVLLLRHSRQLQADPVDHAACQPVLCLLHLFSDQG